MVNRGGLKVRKSDLKAGTRCADCCERTRRNEKAGNTSVRVVSITKTGSKKKKREPIWEMEL